MNKQLSFHLPILTNPFYWFWIPLFFLPLLANAQGWQQSYPNLNGYEVVQFFNTADYQAQLKNGKNNGKLKLDLATGMFLNFNQSAPDCDFSAFGADQYISFNQFFDYSITSAGKLRLRRATNVPAPCGSIGTIYFDEEYPLPVADESVATSIVHDLDDNTVFVGGVQQLSPISVNTEFNIFIKKINATTGQLIWSYSFPNNLTVSGTPPSVRLKYVSQNGGVVFTLSNPSLQPTDLYRINGDGQAMFGPVLIGSPLAQITEVQESADGGVMVSSFLFGASGPSDAPSFAKYDENGDLVFNATPGSILSNELGTFMYQLQLQVALDLPDGGVLLAGKSDGSIGLPGNYLMRISPTGSTDWAEFYPGLGVDFQATFQFPNGEFIFGGMQNGDLFLMKTNSLGQVDAGPDVVDLQLTSATNQPNPPQWSTTTITYTLQNTGTLAADNVTVRVGVCNGLFSQANGLVYANTNFQVSTGTYLHVSQAWNIPFLGPGEIATLSVDLFTLTNEVRRVSGEVVFSPDDVDSTPANWPDCTPDEDDETVVVLNANNGCAIVLDLLGTDCDDNGTPNNTNDDFYFANINVASAGSTCLNEISYTATGGVSGNGLINSNFSIGPFNANDFASSITFTNGTGPAKATINVKSPGHCSGSSIQLPDFQTFTWNNFVGNPAGPGSTVFAPGGVICFPQSQIHGTAAPGFVPPGPLAVDLYLSADNSLSNDDILFYNTSQGYGNPGGSGDLFGEGGNGCTTLPANIAPGTYQILAKLDPNNHLQEANENNNVFVMVTITIQSSNGGGNGITFDCPGDVTVQVGPVVNPGPCNDGSPVSLPIATTDCAGGGLSVILSSYDVLNGNITVTYPGGSCGPIYIVGTGSVQLNFSATDACGNMAICSNQFTREAVQHTVQFTNCPSDIHITAPAGASGAIVDWPALIVEQTDCPAGSADPVPIQLLGPSAGSTFPIGTTEVGFHAYSCFNVETFCFFNVTIEEGMSGIGDIDLSLNLQQLNASPAQWSTYQVELTIHNDGPATATGVKVKFAKPNGVVYVGGNEFSASQGSFNPNGDEVWTAGSIPANGLATLTVNYFLLNTTAPIAYAQVTNHNETDSDSQPNNGTPPTPNQDDEASTANGGGPPNLQPDLTITDLQIPNASVDAGEILYYNFDASNIGTGAVPGDFTIKSYISTDNVLSGNDIQDGLIQTGNFDASYSVQNVQGASTIPANLAAGQYYLIVKIDADEVVTEINEGNNIIAKPFTVEGSSSASCAFTTYYDPTALIPPSITDEFSFAEGISGYSVWQNNENATALPFTEADEYELDAEGNVLSESVITIDPYIVTVVSDSDNNLSLVFEQTPDLPAGTVLPIDINYANPADVLHNSHAVKTSNGYAFGIGIVDASGPSVQIINRVITTDNVGQNVEMYELTDPAFFSGFSRLLEGPDGSLFTSWQTAGKFSLFIIPADGSAFWQVGVATDTPSSEWVDTEVSMDGEFFYTMKTDNQVATVIKHSLSTAISTELDLVDLKTSALPNGFRQTRASGIEPTADGGLLLSLQAFEVVGNAPDMMVLAKYDAAGNLVWKQEIPDPNFNVEPLGETTDGGALFFGQAFVNSTFPADQVIFIKTAENGALTPLCGDTPPPPSGDCSAVTITPSPGHITITGANAPHVLIKVFKPNWQVAFECLDNCPNPVVISGLSAGNHYVEFKLLDADWGEICKIEQTVNVSSFGGSGGTSLHSKNSRQRMAFDNIYPNPAKYVVTLEIFSKDKQNSVLDFYNQQGQSVHRMEVDLAIGRNKIELDISHWRSGAYNVIGRSNGHPAYGRFLKVWED